MSGLTRRDFEALWIRVDTEALERKDSQGALQFLTEYYSRLDDDDRFVVNRVLTLWVSEANPRQRYDALAMIRKFEIRSALPSLRENLARLAHATGPSVPFDREQVEEIIAGLE
jgi:hypothetical protein